MPPWSLLTPAVVATTHKHLQVLTSVYDKTPQFKMNVMIFIKIKENFIGLSAISEDTPG